MTQYVDIQYIRNALGITGTKESCKGCKYNEPIGFACNTYEAPSFAYVCEVLDDAPVVDAVPVVRCKECKHFEYDHFDAVYFPTETGEAERVPLITAHEICTRWGDGCKTDQNGFCFMAERKEE